MFMLLEIVDSTAGLAIKAALVAAFLDFAFGAFAAIRDGTFAMDAVAAFLRKHLVGRVLPVSILAVVGYLTADPIMLAAGIGSLTAYAAETVASIYSSLTVERQPVPLD